LLSDVQFLGVLRQTPAEHTSSVHALLSVQVAALLSLCWQPALALHVSFVHGLPSLQLLRAPAAHSPLALHLSL
jgi:hypothetical protein